MPVARLVKSYFAEQHILSNAGLPVPVVSVGKLGYPDLAEKALRDEMCDMIMLARPLLADPQWANKAYAGRVDEICPCIGDQEACINEFIEGGHPQCSVNPRTGLEDVIERELIPTSNPRKVAVVGAGPAGILTAITAARRGHAVTLFDRRERMGGWLIPGSVPKIKYEVGNYLRYLEAQVADCQQRFGLQLRLGVEVTPDLIRADGFDALVVAAGAGPVGLPVPGADGPQVVQAVELFMHPEWAEKAAEVVVVGGGAVGCEAAHWLSSELGKKVTVVEMLPHFMKGLCSANRGHMIHDLEKRGVPLWNCTRLKSIQPGQVTVVRNVSNTVPSPYVTWTPLLPENIPNPLAKPMREELQETTLRADLVVLAVGLRPDRSLYDACQQQHAAAEVVYIGDNFSVGRVFEAVKAGFSVGRSL